MSRIACVFALGLIVACSTEKSSNDASSDAGATSGSGASDTTGATGGGSVPTSGPSASGATSGNSTAGNPTSGPASDGTSASGGSSGASFVEQPDGGGGNECNPRQQDCPDGEKCVAWANDGGSSWNANKCVPVTGSGVHGDVCTAEGGSISGLDDCDKGHQCYQVDEMGMGHCVAFCDENDGCPTGATCANLNDGVLPICVTGCDPLLQDCPEGQGCYAVEEDETQISCRTDASGAAGFDGDPCEFDNICDPGLLCAPGSAGCTGARCCTPWCDLNESNTCPGAGEECIAHSTNLPPGLDHVGECVIP